MKIAVPGNTSLAEASAGVTRDMLQQPGCPSLATAPLCLMITFIIISHIIIQYNIIIWIIN